MVDQKYPFRQQGPGMNDYVIQEPKLPEGMAGFEQIADAIRAKGGNCTAAESFIPAMVDAITSLAAKADTAHAQGFRDGIEAAAQVADNANHSNGLSWQQDAIATAIRAIEWPAHD